MQINVSYYSGETTPPTGFQSAINYVTNYFDSLITNNITVNIQVGYGRYDGGLSVPRGGSAENDYSRNGSTNATFFSYSTVKAALLNQPLSAADLIAINSLPASDPLGSGNDIYVQPSEARALGLTAGTGNGSIDAYVGFGLPPAGSPYTFDPNNRAVPGEADFIGIALHEFSHALGRISQVGASGGFSVLDLFRWSGTPSQHIRDVQNGDQTYFSIDGGQTPIKNFDISSDPGDWANGTANNTNPSAYVPDSGNAIYYDGYKNDFTAADLTALDVLGYNLQSFTIISGAATVTGIGGAVLSIPMDTQANVVLLQPLLTNISNGVVAGTILPSLPAAPPAIPAGKSGMLQIDSAAQVTIPAGYATAIVDATDPVTITGGSSGGQLIAAGKGGLTFSAGSGAGSVFAGGGNNLAFVGDLGGSQFIALGNGNDTINVMGGNNTLAGGTGSNLIFLGTGQNTVTTGGADTLVAGTGNAAVTASGTGALVFGNFTSSASTLDAVLSGSQATISAAISFTSVTTSGTNAVVFGSFGAAPGGLNVIDTGRTDTVYSGFFGAAATLAGANGLMYGNFNNTPGSLSIRDIGSADTISAANSALTATLSGSQALLFGGYGNIAGALNVVDTGRADTIATGNSNTTITGGSGGSGLLVFGGTGTFNFVGGSGTATVVAGTGPSTVSGGSGGTTLFGSAGSAVALAGNQGVLYVAGGGNETLNGGGSFGGHELVGGSGADVMLGGHGSDTLFAGAGAETLGGGGSSDAFAFVSGRTHGNSVVIQDFISSDTIFLTGYGGNAAATALNGASSTNGNTTITLADNTQVTFLNVASANAIQGHVFSF